MLYQGRLDEAEPWLERAERTLRTEVEPAAGMSLRYARAVLELARGRYQEALAAFRGAEKLAATLVTALLLEARASDALGDQAAAGLVLERALDITESNGIVLPFLLDPAPALLERHRRYRTAHPALISQILNLLLRPTRAVPPSGSQARWARSRGLVEQLTDCETRVLRYLPTHLTMHEIAKEMFVSVNTVSTHTRHLYAKLGVHSRHEAVDRARALGLLAPSTRRA